MIDLRDNIKKDLKLSMGMSNDYEIALSLKSDLVRSWFENIQVKKLLIINKYIYNNTHVIVEKSSKVLLKSVN